MHESQVQPSNEQSPPQSEPAADGERETYGFRPAVIPEERRPEEKRDTPAMKLKREQINRLLCRYPQLRLRSSKNLMAGLMQHDEEELNNIMENAQNDLMAIRGAPMADLAINVVCGGIDRYLEGFLERCRNDSELQHDVQSEATLLFGGCSARANIAFRLLNNAYDCWHDPEAPYPDERGAEWSARNGLSRENGEGGASEYFEQVPARTKENSKRDGTGGEEDSSSQ